jgi:hypothetical protein
MAPAPNPRHDALHQALTEIRPRIAVLEAAMNVPHQKFTGSVVWVGQTARAFATDLTRRRDRLRQIAQAILDELEDELKATPESLP